MRKFNRLFIRGDTHGNFDWLTDFCQKYQTTENDLMVILGDVGLNYYGCKSKREKALKTYVSKQPITLFCVRGNHEDRPEDRPDYQLVDRNIGAHVYVNEEYPNQWFAQDGGEYTINDHNVLVIGGAYSVDKFYRISMGWKWVANEELNDSEFATIYDTVYHKHYTDVFTHTCPFEWMPVDLFLKGMPQTGISNEMERHLSHVVRYCTFDNWYFGHYHSHRMDVIGDGKVHLLYEEVVEWT